MTGIYKITSPTGKVYIGKTKRFSARLSTYRNLVKQSIGRALFSSLIKYGFHSHEIQLINHLPADISSNDLNNQERAYILFYREAGFNLLNLTNGGDGSEGYRHTDAAKKIISEKRKGLFTGEDNPNYGKGCFGSKNGAFGKDRMKFIRLAAKANEKPVYQYSVDGTLMRAFDSATAA